MAFTCPRCNATSHHPKDEEYGYCGRCNWWTGDEFLGKPEVVNAAVDEGAIRPLAEVGVIGHTERGR
jgi:hypothetical protein